MDRRGLVCLILVALSVMFLSNFGVWVLDMCQLWPVVQGLLIVFHSCVSIFGRCPIGKRMVRTEVFPDMAGKCPTGSVVFGEYRSRIRAIGVGGIQMRGLIQE